MIQNRVRQVIGLLAIGGWAGPAIAQDRDGDDGPGKPTSAITITARRLDAARANIEPSLGASSYSLTNDTVEARPGGETTTIAKILLQTPGAAQDGAGKLRVRQSQGALQYRINNVILPDGLDDLGESLSPRIAAKIDLITGALPAQYGFNTGGVVNVTTKDGVYLDGGQAEIYGGSHGVVEPALEYGGSIQDTNFFVTASYLHSHVGLPSPEDSAAPRHDRTGQYEGLAYFDHVVSPTMRVALVFGASNDEFQIPNRTGLSSATANLGIVAFQRPLTLNGIASISSDQRDDRRDSLNRYMVLSLLQASDALTLQIAGFTRYSRATYSADAIADILFTGVGRSSRDTVISTGLQAEAVHELAATHTMRFGATIISDIHRGQARTLALPIDAAGIQVPGVLKQQDELNRVAVRRDSIFVQDEWRPIKGVTLNFGSRADHVKTSVDRTKLSPRVNLAWQPRPEVVLHIGYARYFISAPIDSVTEKPADLLFTSAALPTSTGNAVLPETDNYYDIGFQYADGPLTAAIDAYWRRANNLIDDGIFGASAQSASFNYKQGRVRGVELSLTYNAGRLSGWANITVGEGRAKGIASNQFYFTASELSYAANTWIKTTNSQSVTLSSGLSYRLGPLRLSGDILFSTGSRRTITSKLPNGSPVPAYIQTDFSAVWQLASLNKLPLALRADIINLFDRRYLLADGSGLGSSLSAWGPNRGVFLGVEQSF